MRTLRFTQVLVLISSLSLSACTAVYASGLPQTDGDKPVKNRECPSTVQHVCDSVFHGYLDSLDYRIHALNDVAHRVDSLAQLFNQDHHMKLFMDGRKFGPVHIPPMHIPSQELPELQVQIPEMNTPEVNVPSIEIPDIHIDVDSMLPNLSEVWTHTGHIDPSQIERGGVFSGKVYIDPGSTNILSSESDDSYVDPGSGARYFIRNAKPTQKAKRVAPDSEIWLLNSR